MRKWVRHWRRPHEAHSALAGEADGIAADGAALHMIAAGPLATGPTLGAAIVTVLTSADRAGGHTALCTVDLLTRAALADAVVAGDVPVAIQSDERGLLSTS